MNSENVQALFARVFDGSAGAATAPLLVLGIGIVLLLAFEIAPALRMLRPLAIVGALGGAAAEELAILAAGTSHTVFDGTYVADATTAVWGLVFLSAAALAWLYSVGHYRRQDAPYKTEHDALLLAAPAGMMLMVGARDLIVFFIGLELLSIPLYCLAGFQRMRTRSVEAGLKYFMLGAFMTGFFLYGASLIYAATGSLRLADLAQADLSSPLVLAGGALLVASLLFKMGAFPFHLWVPDVYQGSPTPVTTLMVGGTKAAALGFLLPASFLLPAHGAGTLAALAIVTMALGNLAALRQDNLKRLFAYSSVAHAGTMLLVVAAALAAGKGPDEATRAALFYAAAYVFAAGGSFGLIALLESEGERFSEVRGLAGLGRRRPAMAGALTVFLLSLGGIPATGGFLGKWFVFSVLVDAEMTGTAVIAALLSVVALGYYLRLIVVMWMEEAPAGEPLPLESRPLTAGPATLACVVATLALGLFPGWLIDWIS